jgi:hypothetical protein
MIRYASRVGLQETDWMPSLDLVRAEIRRSLHDLGEEVRERKDFLEGEELVDGAELYRARVTIVLGALATHELTLPANEAGLGDRLITLLQEHRHRLWLWGESAFPFFFSISKYLETASQPADAIELLSAVLEGTVTSFTRSRATELAPPYYSATSVLTVLAGVNGAEPAHLLSSGGSFIVRPTLEALARRGAREPVARLWKQASRVPVREFRPTNVFDLFSWRVSDGRNVTEILPCTQSWAQLQAEARELPTEFEALRPYRDILHYFTIICPFRATRDVLKLLEA